MTSLPSISGDDFVRAGAHLGYLYDRTRGSHMILYCSGRSPLSVPRHRELDRGTAAQLIRRAGVSVDQFAELLNR